MRRSTRCGGGCCGDFRRRGEARRAQRRSVLHRRRCERSSRRRRTLLRRRKMQLSNLIPPLRSLFRTLGSAVGRLPSRSGELQISMERGRELPSNQAQPSLVVTRHGEPVQADEFEGPKLKIARAKRHIADYRLAFKALGEANIIAATPEVDPETGNDLWKVRLTQPIPSDLRLTAADAIYNLRSALDQAVCSCVRLAGKSPKDTYFPHGVNKAGFEISLREKCEKVPEPVRAAIAGLEPYHGGSGYLLRVLHDLNIVDKHRDLIKVGVTLRKFSVSSGVGTSPKGPI